MYVRIIEILDSGLKKTEQYHFLKKQLYVSFN